MIQLSKGQVAVLIAAATPMAAVGVAGAVATFVNMNNVLHRGASALGLVAAGEGATLICALIALAVTLMGQHTPLAVRFGMWLIPLVASGAGVALAPNRTEMVVMGITPLAMTAAGEGVAFVARRVVAYRTGVDIEQQRRSGLLLWHANRAANGTGLGRKVSEAAVWRLTKQFAATDNQLSVQLGEIQRYRIGEGADANLAAVLTKGPDTGVHGGERPSVAPAPPAPSLPPAAPSEDVSGAHSASDQAVIGGEKYEIVPVEAPDSFGWIQNILDESEERAAAEPQVKLLTSDDVAVQLNVKPGTVRSWVHRDKLRVHDRDAHGRALFHPSDVDMLGS